jgi:isoleucyl-tRNA synthetase
MTNWLRHSASAPLPVQTGYCVIWTTTPWTIPSNQALNMHPEVVYALVKTERDGETFCC